MKFILLGVGKIAERFLSEKRFEYQIKDNMVGIISSQTVIDNLKSRSQSVPHLPSYAICDKDRNETELYSLISAVRPNYLLSVQYPWILPGSILNLMSGRVANLHNAKLPDYRGHNTISHEILNEETTHTSTLHWVVEEVDRGRVIKVRDIPILGDDTAYSLWTRSVDSSLDLLESWFADLTNNFGFTAGEPIETGGHYYKKDISQKKQIPNDATTEIIDKWARAFWFPPHEPAYHCHGHRKLYVLPNTTNYAISVVV